MTAAGWREGVLMAVQKHEAGDSSMLELLAALLEEQDLAKQVLRDKGYGCTGMGWMRTVNEVREAAG